MNCKQDDLAVVVKAGPGTEMFIGRVVKCLSLIGEYRAFEKFKHPRTGQRVLSSLGGFVWDVEGLPCASDEGLRPIRDQDGEDEILRIAGHPNKEIA